MNWIKNKNYGIIKKELTNESDGIYTESLKTVNTAFAPVSISDFFVFANGRMRAENIQYQPKHLFTAFSESATSQFCVAFLKKVNKMTNTIKQTITSNTINCIHKARVTMEALWEQTDNIYVQKELKRVSKQLAQLSVDIMDANSCDLLFYKEGK